jgi:FkbM family methyltransferase
MVASLARVETTIKKGNRMWYEPNEYPYFKKLIKQDTNVFFDVGAMIGYYCFLAAGNGAKKVIGFEIMKEYADFTNKMLKKNNIDGFVYNVAVGSGVIHYENALTNGTCKSIKLDDFARETKLYPDVVKMDIEGHEYNVLLGAGDVLKKCQSIDISIHKEYLNEFGFSGKDTLDIIYKLGYKKVFDFCETYFLSK